MCMTTIHADQLRMELKVVKTSKRPGVQPFTIHHRQGLSGKESSIVPRTGKIVMT